MKVLHVSASGRALYRKAVHPHPHPHHHHLSVFIANFRKLSFFTIFSFFMTYFKIACTYACAGTRGKNDQVLNFSYKINFSYLNELQAPIIAGPPWFYQGPGPLSCTTPLQATIFLQ